MTATTFVKITQRNIGILTIIAGIVICLMGFIFASDTWDSRNSFFGNVSYAYIAIPHGKVTQRGYMEFGRFYPLMVGEQTSNPIKMREYNVTFDIKLKYLLAAGVLMSAIGAGVLLTMPQGKPA
jgi:hypothetical protein